MISVYYGMGHSIRLRAKITVLPIGMMPPKWVT